jgi:hypothetical protein
MHASMLRRELRRWLDGDVTEDEAGDIALSAYEAIAEIVTQTDPLDAGPIRLQAHLDDDHVRVAISYTGNWDAPSDPEHSQHRLTLIRALTDELVPVARTSDLRWLWPPGRMLPCLHLTRLSSAVERSSWPVWASDRSRRWPSNCLSVSRVCGIGWLRLTLTSAAAIVG